jgi:hypothetical protein
VIHYRQGVGGFVTYPGQNTSRETSLVKFEEAILSILDKAGQNSIKSIVVLTDAPKDVTFYRPPTDQQILWEGTPGYVNGMMTIQPLNFASLSEKFDLPIEIYRGGNPLDAVSIMAESDFLLMSKSSLSYLGGLFNRAGKVYSVKNFWHRPLPRWEVF